MLFSGRKFNEVGMRTVIKSLMCMLLVFCCQVVPANAEVIKATSNDYTLGLGDVVRVSVYANPDMATETRVAEDGNITLPFIGDVLVKGLTPKLAQQKIAKLLDAGGYVKNAQVNLLVSQYQSQIVSVMGEVNRPGKIVLEKPTKLSELIGLAGGLNGNASDWITLIREVQGESKTFRYDLRELLVKGNPNSNPQILPNDVVYIDAREVSVLGQVNRPGKYSIVSGVRNVIDFISLAGGVSSSGADKVIVMTQRDGKKEKHEVDIDLLFQGSSHLSTIELAAGDTIYVPRFPVFYIYGEVQRAGAYRLERNMIVSQALSMGGGLSQRGSERRIKIKRIVEGKTQELDVRGADLVQANDVIYVNESLF
jgi:polysaccharide biosynthesis/export protein